MGLLVGVAVVGSMVGVAVVGMLVGPLVGLNVINVTSTLLVTIS